jgi:MerR family transcriptional regulator/heat shock protein HspR
MTQSLRLQRIINRLKSVKMILTITEIADKLGVHEQTLRNWERLGLLKVSRIGGNRTRIYDDNDLQLCKKIANFSDQGINLRGIKALLAMEKTEKLN